MPGEEVALNYYGQPIIDPGRFMELHIASPMGAGMPPVCSCGWTRWEYAPGKWFEMSDHLANYRETYVKTA